MTRTDIWLTVLFGLSLTIYFGLMNLVPGKVFQDPLLYEQGIRLVADDFDRAVYGYYGSWVQLEQRPYSAKLAYDMPQLAILFFGAIGLLTDGEAEFAFAFSLVMVFVTIGAFALFLAIRRQLSSTSPWSVVLWFHPLMFYFYLNRFDMLVIVLFLFSLWSIMSNRQLTGGILFTAAVLVKWFPAVCVLPLLLAVHQQRGWRDTARFAIGAGGFAAVIGILTVMTVGWVGALMPYQMQTSTPNRESLYAFVLPLLGETRHLATIFLALQLLPALVLPVLIRNYSLETLSRVISLLILVFILLCTKQSPQWVLWALPFLLLVIHDWKWALAVLLFETVSYLYFPVFYDIYGPGDPRFQLVVGSRILLMVVMAIVLLLSLLPGTRFRPRWCCRMAAPGRVDGGG